MRSDAIEDPASRIGAINQRCNEPDACGSAAGLIIQLRNDDYGNGLAEKGKSADPLQMNPVDGPSEMEAAIWRPMINQII